MGGRGGAKSDRSGGTCPQEWAGDLLGLRSSEAGLRSAAGTAIRVRTLVGDGRILSVAMRRVDCRGCGVTVERVPWARGKSHLTTSYRWFLARWAKHLSWDEVACM